MLSFRTATSRSQLLNTQITWVAPQWLTGCLVTSLSGLGHLCLTHLPSASPVCEMLSTPTGLRARASWAQLHTPVHTLPPNSLFVGSQSELVSPVKTDSEQV